MLVLVQLLTGSLRPLHLPNTACSRPLSARQPVAARVLRNTMRKSRFAAQMTAPKPWATSFPKSSAWTSPADERMLARYLTLPQIYDEAEVIADDAKANFGHLNSQQLNWKPAADSWRVAQCLDHRIPYTFPQNPAVVFFPICSYIDET